MAKFISDLTLVSKDALPVATSFIHGRDTARSLGDRDVRMAITDFASGGVRETTIGTNTLITPNADTTDILTVTALATSVTFQDPTGTPVQGQRLVIRITDNGGARFLTYTPIYNSLHIPLPVATIASKDVYIFLIFNSTAGTWDVVGVFQQDGPTEISGLRIITRTNGEIFRLQATNAGTPASFFTFFDAGGRTAVIGMSSSGNDDFIISNETDAGNLDFLTNSLFRYRILADGNHDFKSGDIVTLGTIAGSNLSGVNTGDEDAASINALGATMNDDVDVKANGWVLDEDDFSSDSDTKVPTQQSTKAFISAQVTGLWDDKGAYDAATNTPDLDVSPAGIFQSDAFAVSVAGLFFGATVEVGDLLVAKQDNPTVESDWNIFQANLDASSIKALYESNADTNAFVDAEKTKLTGIETDAKDDQTDAEIATAYGNEVAAASQVEMEAGTEAALRTVSPLRVAEAIAALAGGDAVVEFPASGFTGDHTLALGDAGKLFFYVNGGGDKTITIPANSSVAFPIGTIIKFYNDNGSGTLTVNITTDELRKYPSGGAGSRTLVALSEATLMKVSATRWVMSSSGGLT